MAADGALKVCVVGSGYFAGFHVESWARLPEVSLAGICSKDRDSVQTLANANGDVPVFSSLEEMLAHAKPELVDLVTPPATHLDLIQECVASGADVICQKPFCGNVEEAQEAVALADAHGQLLVVHENFRFQPWYRRIKTLLSEGALGEVYQATFKMRPGDGQGADAYMARQPYFQKMDRFLVHETAIHWVDTFRFLFGEITAVFADLRQLNPAIAGEDAGTILMQFSNGPRCIYDGNRLSDHAARNRRLTLGELWIEGSKASLRLDGDGGLWLRRFGENDEIRIPYDWQDTGFGGDCVHALNSHVVDHLTKGLPVENRACDYLVNLQIEEAIYKSNQTGSWAVPDNDQEVLR